MATASPRPFRVTRWLALLLVACIVGLAAAPPAFGQTSAGRVLILGTTVTGGTASIEATKAASLGFSVDVVTPTQWATLSAADFASYRAIVLGDPTCAVGESPIAAAIANADVWGPIVNGNVVVIGTDPVDHAQFGTMPEAARRLTDNAVAHATAVEGATGAYISLSCYYFDASPDTPVPLLDAFSPGGFTIRGSSSDVAHINAPSSPVLAGLTDVTLSNWAVSIHEVFDAWPGNFEVLVVDTVTGKPYILSRGPTRPTGIDQCKNGGWRNFPGFKNQGDCVSFVATKGRNPPAGH